MYMYTYVWIYMFIKQLSSERNVEEMTWTKRTSTLCNVCKLVCVRVSVWECVCV